MADLDGEDLKSLKRSAAIRAKEEEFEKKRRQEEDKKRQQLAKLKEEYDSQLERREQERVRLLKKQAEVRAAKRAEVDRLNARREDKIQIKYNTWLERASNEIHEVIDEHLEEEERVKQALDQARARKAAKAQAVKVKIQAAKDANQELDSRRSDENDFRQSQRELKEISRVDKLKSEAQEELESFILEPAPVPLKQVIAGRLRPVPRVTELLASYKDTKEDLEDLEAQDIPTRALLCNQSIFLYVRDIQLKAESVRIRPPEPEERDLGRRAAALTTRKGSKSPNASRKMGASTRQGMRSSR